MKILQLGKFYPIRGGVEKVMYDLMIGLSQGGVFCDMLCATTEEHPGGELLINNFGKVVAIPTKIKLAATMIAPGMITWLRKNARFYDIIHIHHPDPMACLALYCSGYKGKVVLHWHSDILKQKTLLKFYSPLLNWMIRRADLILGTSPVYVKESPFLAHVQAKVDFLPIGVDPVVADSKEVRKIRDRYHGKKIVFSLGRLVAYKGYEYLVKAAVHLPDDYMVVIGGTGPLRESLRNLIEELGVSRKVELIGFVSDEELPAYFHACDLFCLSSVLKTEAFAIVQIEAMSCGKPVVSTRIPGSGVSWVNQHKLSGLTVEPGDDLALAEAFVQILSDSDFYQNLSQGATARFEAYFTAQEMIKQCMVRYNQLFK